MEETQEQEQEQEQEQSNSSITLELGDVIEIVAPTNPDLNNINAIITYIDDEKIKLINIASSKMYLLNITAENRFTDESITEIHLLYRSDEKGYARQNNLLPITWVDIHFGGDFPVIITGEITNLEEDMIEITRYPEMSVIYIDFEYKGIPEELPIDKIVIRQKPASLGNIGSLALISKYSEENETGILSNISPESVASIEYTDVGESIITIPEGTVADENITDTLNNLYIDSDSIIFGEMLEKVVNIVEVSENEKRYSIDEQTNDFMDELLSTIPMSKRTKIVMDNIHLIIERFKELREEFSKFDKNDNAYDAKFTTAFHKPLIQHIRNLDTKLQWLIPVVSNRKKLMSITSNEDGNTTIDDAIVSTGISRIGNIQDQYYKKNTNTPNYYYPAIEKQINEILTPFEKPLNENKMLINTKVNTNLDVIIDNLEDFYSTVYKHSGDDNETTARKQYLVQRYNLGTKRVEKQILKTGKTIYIQKDLTPNDSISVKSVLILPEPFVRLSAIELPGTKLLKRVEYHDNFLMLFRLLRKNTNITTHVIDDLSKELDYDEMEKRVLIYYVNPIEVEKFLNK